MNAEPPLPPDDALSKERLRLWLKLLKASRAIEDELRRRLRRDFGSTLPRFDVMSALARFPDGLKMSALSDVLKVSNGNVTGIVAKLEQEGLVQRRPVPGDRRATLAWLTPRGRDEFRRQAEIHEGWVNTLLSGLDGDDVEGMNLRLDRLVDAMDRKGS